MKKNKKGITLVALVITVIILLILAGTAISISINGGSIFEKTATSREEWNAAVENEESSLSDVLTILEEVSPSIVTVSTNYPVGWNDKNNLSGVAEAGTRKAPIPSGFVISDVEGENTITNGLVIYEGTEQVSTDEDAITTRNQFVWIPVDNINQMVMCKDNNKNSDGTVCNLVTQSDGSLKCMTHHANDDGTELCGRLFGAKATTNSTGAVSESNPFIYQTSINFNRRNQSWTTNGSIEPNTAPDATENGLIGVKRILNNTTATSYSEVESAWKNEFEGNFKAMAESVAKYGGFYVARYEAGYDSDSYTSKKGQNVMNATTEENKGADKWYGLYKHLRGTKGGATSTMIWGCQYDQVINFIGAEAEIAHANINLPRTANITSGETPLNAMKNINDLEGNYWELTAQNGITLYRAGRGGSYDTAGRNYFKPASDIAFSYPTNTIACYASRSTLYM